MLSQCYLKSFQNLVLHDASYQLVLNDNDIVLIYDETKVCVM